MYTHRRRDLESKEIPARKYWVLRSSTLTTYRLGVGPSQRKPERGLTFFSTDDAFKLKLLRRRIQAVLDGMEMHIDKCLEDLVTYKSRCHGSWSKEEQC